LLSHQLRLAPIAYGELHDCESLFERHGFKLPAEAPTGRLNVLKCLL